jgi:TolB-like protein
VVKPFSDLEPDPAQVSLGDDIAREFEKSLARYARFDTGPSDGLTPFVLTGQTQKKKGPKRTIRAQVTWDGRQYWSTAFAAKDENRAAATAKAVDALAKKMKVALKHA